MSKPSFFAELKRRNVLRAATLYAAGAWLLVQVATQVFPLFHIEEWIVRWIVIAAVIGFPFAMVLSWFYELTPEGFKPESEVEKDASVVRATGKTLDRWIIAVLSIAVVLLLANTFVLHRDATSTANAVDDKAVAATLAKLPEKSVAVLPLVNESGDPKQVYFSDGLSEELISDLTQIDGLKVIGKYSSFKFRDSKDSPAQIGAALGVAHLIQGSVRQQGDRIRVTVDMINASDGASVWSHSYDEQLKDVFAIQTRIGQAVAAALQVKLLGKTLVSDDKPPGGSVEAYQFMLQGRTLCRRETEADIRQCIALLQQSLQLDPNYAYAWATLSDYSAELGANLTGDARRELYAQARAAMDKAQALAPDAANIQRIHGDLSLILDNDPAAALAEFKRALALAPNDGTSINFLAYGLQTVGQLQPAAELFRKAIATDPLRAQFQRNLSRVLLGLGQLDAAEQATHKTLVLQPDSPGMYALLAQIDILRGDAAAALRDANQETDPVSGPWALALAKQSGADHQQADAALQDYLAKNGKDQPYLVADLYALRKQPDTLFEWLQRAWTQHDPNFTANLLSDPFVLVYEHDPRFAALCKQAGLPLPGEALPTATATTP
jgi:adenylate cyclase